MKKFLAILMGLLFASSAVLATGCPAGDDDDSADDDSAM
jgi:hypothetical protein